MDSGSACTERTDTSKSCPSRPRLTPRLAVLERAGLVTNGGQDVTRWSARTLPPWSLPGVCSTTTRSCGARLIGANTYQLHAKEPVAGARFAPASSPGDRVDWPWFWMVAAWNDRVVKVPRVRMVAGVILLSAVASGCSSAGSDATPATTERTTLRPTTTTVGVSATSSSPTSTTSAHSDGVTVDPNLPSAMNSAAIPWDQVGSGWYVVLYDPSRANPTSDTDVREGPMVLYLANAAGERYEVAAWAPGQYPTLIDATTTSALVARTGSDFDETVFEVLDLTTGIATIAYTFRPPESFLDIWPHASLTRPNGENVVVHRSDGTIEWLERRTPDGTVITTVYERPLIGQAANMSWLYGPEGTSLVVRHRDGIEYVTNDGSIHGELWTPPDTRCEPVRWWDADTFLAVCYGQGTDSAPLDDYGQPHLFYGRLWLLESDGSTGTALTNFPDEPPMVVDFGYQDAWPTKDDTFLQWSGDCGASAVATLNMDGTGDFLEIATPNDVLADGIRMVDIRSGEMTLYGWQGCDARIGVLFTSDLDGHYLNTLVPVIGDSRGVIGVEGLTTVYPEVASR